ncbi:MAG: hypothetical protein JXA20_00965 [Spirochaetes bacterium]|nr:hypothetical protein [Spirochaetota bacterium]
MPLHYILMGDIIGSSEYDAQRLRDDFMSVVSSCNIRLGKNIISPYTVTLGDEFQGIATSLDTIINSIFFMEEISLRRSLAYKVRYVAVLGHIDTTINRMKAHTMMGDGLTKARRILNDKRRGLPRFRFDLPDSFMTKQLNRLFLVLDGITNRWSIGDGILILDMLANTNNAEVGSIHGKNRTQIWKRRKNLLIEEYRVLKDALIELTQQNRTNT